MFSVLRVVTIFVMYYRTLFLVSNNSSVTSLPDIIPSTDGGIGNEDFDFIMCWKGEGQIRNLNNKEERLCMARSELVAVIVNMAKP